MLEAILIGAVVVAVLACPVMMLLGRRGIGPGCRMMGACKPSADEPESLESLRGREREIARRIAELETAERTPSTGSAAGMRSG